MKTIDIPRPGGGVTTCRILATFRAVIGKERLTFHALRLPPPFGKVSCTEAKSGERFPELIALIGERVTTARAVAVGRAIIRAAVKRHGAAHVLKVIKKAQRATAALPEFKTKP